MALVFVKPLINWNIPSLTDPFENYSYEARRAVVQGSDILNISLEDIIREHTEAYILSEANSIGADITVQVELDGSDPPVPTAVTICGYYDADSEALLSNQIFREVGIPKERQTWIRLKNHE